ncbi:MAG: 2-dehydro-3-deoxy-6-phosphogalactonate aldolase [Comamonadaceae bacterium]|nr:2-dehydro-3-deoxy-6-phosphogalactonate aldolase [Comamonadaceae bacterium]
MTNETTLTARFVAAQTALPLIAILRGIRPPEAVDIGVSLMDAGFRLIEVPLNSPDPFTSIAALRQALPAEVLVGAGTVLEAGQIGQLYDCGAELAVMPHANVSLIRAAKAAGLLCVPGIVTPTEAFAALAVGADALKIFPAELVTPAVLKAMCAVLPKGTGLLPVGGIKPESMKPYVDAGASGFGLGSALYKPGMTAQQTAATARQFVAAWRVIRPM